MQFVVLGARQAAGVLSGRHFIFEVIYYAYRFCSVAPFLTEQDAA
jgi:hypothetical protein